MDPNETMRLWNLALLEERSDDAKEHWYDLVNWLNRGGFKPTALYNPLAYAQFFSQFNPKTGRLDR